MDDLIKRLRSEHGTLAGLIEAAHKAADRIEAQAKEIERLRLEAEKQEALQVSAYHAGLRAGWNFGVSDDNTGMQAAMANTDHIKELHRIREARACLKATQDAVLHGMGVAQGGKHIPLEDFYKPLVFEENDWLIVHLHGVEKGREAERAKIVAWLRSKVDDYAPDDNYAGYYADEINNGEHLK